MKRICTKVTYRVPDWEFCNHQASLTRASKEKCRFCVKHGGKHICVLYNMPLDTCEGHLVKKDIECYRATAGYASVVEDTPEVNIDPRDIMRLTIQEYRKVYNALIAQGYPANMADKLAQQSILGGK